MKTTSLAFRSAFDVATPPDLTTAAGLAQLLSFHRAHFGGARMEDPPAPDPAPAPAPDPAPAPADRGFPANTAVAEMSVEQQAAYWKFQSRKHEDAAKARGDYDDVKRAGEQFKAELEALRQAQMSESEKALAAARAEGAQAAKEEATASFTQRERERGIKLVDDFLALATSEGGRLERDRDRITPVLDALDKSKFLTAEGDVDTAALAQFVTSLASPAAPAGSGRWPATGQGRREAPPSDRGVAAGRELYQARRGRPAKPAAS